MTPKGFLFSAVEAAVKRPGRKDLALIYSEREAVVSGMFTKNKVKAAPVKLDMKRIKAGRGRAIIVNSGNANACVGEQGMHDATEIADLAAASLTIKPTDIFVCSTGVIGTPMPMDRIRQKITELANNLGRATIDDVAAAIMTTDTFPKVISRRLKVGNDSISITGICKGAGMICPEMATMLCFIITDARIEREALDRALQVAVRKSFNAITVDGDMSTNDTVLIMANGLSDNEVIRRETTALSVFTVALSEVCYELSRLIVKDGEGATKFIEIQVINARNDRQAERAAFAIANSLLVKTAIYGNDANWGRFMAVLGYSNIMIHEDKTDIFINGLKIADGGKGTGKDKEAAESLRNKEVEIVIDLHLGSGKAKVLTCDLTEAYVKINAEYRT
ncbi:MAG: bifunctional glutamate N-acetyltransferase/amino-acid acetyltransferase ArgJ [Dissulfurispiraceae bacterium]